MTELTSDLSVNGQWAVYYVKRGWWVLPIWDVQPDGTCACSKADCNAIGKHPRTPRGERDASNDPATVEAIWRQFPEASIAIATGPSYLVLVDCDSKPDVDGHIEFMSWCAVHNCEPQESLSADSGGGGRHFLYRRPDEVSIPSRVGVLPGVDVRGDTGYFVVGPSIHVSQRRYAWRFLEEPEELPEALLNLLARPMEKSQSKIAGIATRDLLRGVPEGQRDDTLFRAACRWWNQTGDVEAVKVLVLETARNCSPPFPTEQALEKVRRACLYPQDRTSSWTGNIEVHATQSRLIEGGDFVFSEPNEVKALWGDGENVLWAFGEAFMIAGPQGVGKTSLAQQLMLAQIGIRDRLFLGYSVTPAERKIMYLAMDRPRQAARSLRRMVSEHHLELLNERLIVWRGPLPFDPTDGHQFLADFVEEHGAGTLYVDSVKDLAPGLSRDDVASALNLSWQEAQARGIEIVLIHHERKAQQNSQSAHQLDDVFGSGWLTAGIGSVVSIIGRPGDPIVELRHLKQPAELVGPLRVHHDHQSGRSIVETGDLSITSILKDHPQGLPIAAIAERIYGRSGSTESKRVEREIKRMEINGLVEKTHGLTTGRGRSPDLWKNSAQSDWAAKQSQDEI